MKNDLLGLGQGEFKFKIRITGHNLFLSFMLWSYMMLMNAAKGFFLSEDGVLGFIGSIADIGIRFFIGIPLLIIDSMPIIASVLLIILHFMGKPVKKIFNTLFVLLLVSHLAYIPLELIGFQRSIQFILAGVLLAILFVYFIFVNEEKSKLKKPLIQYDMNFKLEKYNMTMSILLVLVILIVIATPFIGMSNEASVINDMIEASGSINDAFNNASNALTGTVDDGLGYLNIYAFLLKLPFLILAIHTVVRNFKNKSKVFTLPKKLIVIGMLTFIGVPFMFERLKLDELLSVSGSIKMLGYLLFAWVLFEMVFVNEIDKSLKSLSKQGIEKIGAFADVVKNSKFSSQSLLRMFQKVPFIGKTIKRYFNKKAESSNSMSVSSISSDKELTRESNQSILDQVVLEKGKGYCIESPMLAIEGARLSLVKDKTQLTAYLNIKNVDSETLTAIVVDLIIKDVLGNELERFEGVQILDLNLSSEASSGWINIPSVSNFINARQMALIVRNCVYSNDRILSFSQANVLEFSKVIASEMVETHAEEIHSEEMNSDATPQVSEVISKKASILVKYKPFVIKLIDRLITNVNNVFNKVLSWVKVNQKRSKQLVAGVVSLVMVSVILGWSTSRPLEEDKAIELFYKHINAENSETVDYDLDSISDDFSELEIEWVREFSEYKIVKRDQADFKRNIFGIWAIENVVEFETMITPFFGADASKDKAEITQYLKDKYKDVKGDIQIDFPEVDGFYDTFDRVDLNYVINDDLGMYTGALAIAYGFKENKWEIVDFAFNRDGEIFEPSSEIVIKIESLEFINKNDFQSWKFNGEQIDTAKLEITKNGDIDYNWENKEVSIPLIFALDQDGTKIQVDKIVTFKYVDNAFRAKERDDALELKLVTLHQVGNANMTEYQEDYDFVAADIFKMENSSKEVVVALKANLTPQTFDENGNLSSDTRKMGEIAIFDESGNIVNQDPKFMLTPLHGGYYTELDLLYNDYEMGVNIIVSREIFKYEINDSDYICIKESISSGNVSSLNIAMYSIGDDYQLIERSRSDGYQVEEGGYITESLAQINGQKSEYDELWDYFVNVTAASSGFHVIIESNPANIGQTTIEVLQLGK